MPEPTYKVKRLEWESMVFERVYSIIGEFSAGVQQGQHWWSAPDGSIHLANSLAAAKLAAEQWYRERILEALEPVEERT